MKTMDMDSLKTAWKKEQGFENTKLSESEIQHFLRQKSRDITQLFRKGLIFDVGFKSLKMVAQPLSSGLPWKTGSGFTGIIM